MEDQSPFRRPQQSQPEEDMPSSVPPDSGNVDEETPAAPLVAEEREPATERSDFSAGQTATTEYPAGPAAVPAEVAALSEPAVPPARGNKRKKGIITLVIAAMLVVLLSGGAFAVYKFWYQNPQKVVGDAVMNALTAKSLTYSGNYTSEYGGNKLSLNINGSYADTQSGEINIQATMTYQGTDYKVNGSGMVDKDGTLYVKLSNVGEIFSSLLKQAGTSTTAFDGFIAKVNDTWIKITPDDLNKFGPAANAAKQCLSDAGKMFSTDKTVRQEIIDTYKKYSYFTINNDLGSQKISGQDSIGYTLTVDKAKKKEFSDAAKNTRFGKKMQECDKNLSDFSGSTDTTASDTATLQIWVSKWGHTLTRMKVDSKTAKATDTLTLDPVFNKPVNVRTPAKFLTIQDIQDEFTKATTALQNEIFYNYTSSGSSPFTTPRT